MREEQALGYYGDMWEITKSSIEGGAEEATSKPSPQGCVGINLVKSGMKDDSRKKDDPELGLGN